MQINEQGVKTDKFSEALNAIENKLKKKFGEDYKLDPNSQTGAYIVGMTYLYIKKQEILEDFIKQFDPNTAEGEYQEALYQRVGLDRKKSTKTTLNVFVTAFADTQMDSESIIIRDKVTNLEFTNSSDITIAESGEALTRFECLLEGEQAIDPNSEFELVSAPDGVSQVNIADKPLVMFGINRETDAEFRQRFENIRKNAAKGSRPAVRAQLSKYVDSPRYLKLFDRNNDKTLVPGSVKIIVHHNTTDEIFARAIYDCVVAGLKFVGNTCVYVPTRSPRKQKEIRFEKATQVPVVISAEIKLKGGHYANTVFSNVRKRVVEYATNRMYGLDSTVYATEFIIPILEVSGVEAVKSIAVKTDGEFAPSIKVALNEVPNFNEEEVLLVSSD